VTQRRTPPPSGRARPAAATTRGPATPRTGQTPKQAGGKAATGSTASGSGHSTRATGRSAGARPNGARPSAGRPAGNRPAGTRPTNARSAPARRPTNPTRGRTGGSGGGSGRRSTAVRGGTPAGNPRRRMRFLTVACLFVLSVFGAQLVRIQGFDATAVAQEAQLKREAAQIIPAMRGQVLASDGTVLASSVVREVVVADQTAVCTFGTKKNTCDPATAEEAVQKAATELAPLLNTTVSELVPELTGTSRYRILSRDVTPLTWNTISALGIPGINRDRRETRSERTYPQGSTTAALVGFMTGAGEPGGGVEVMMQKHLVGTPGKQTFELGRDGTIIPVGESSLVPAVDGNDVTLTINSSLQWYAQNALAQRIKETKAKSGTVVIEDVKTGNLLAVASYPSFDPSTDIGKKGTRLSNVAFTDVFEPGSTSKIMTMAAALEEGEVTPSTPVVIPNRLPRYDANFKDSHEHATEYRTVAGTLAESSNIGTILVSETMKSKTLESYFRKFGLGATSGTGFPGESRGLLEPSSQWSGTKKATVAFGQGISVTAIQAASVFQTIANDGVRVTPRLVESVTEADGTVTPSAKSTSKRVVSHQTASDVSRMLEGVVSPEGTAEEAQIPGYRVAGKTGTADYYDAAAGRYSGRTASFIGYAPADDPQIVVAVIIQKPTYPFFGGYVSGPVFKDVTTYALQELKIPPTGRKAPEVTLKVTPKEALSDPTVLRNGHKRSDR
jgi:cell division protein FtsI (penicillin-binding protein 3)